MTAPETVHAALTDIATRFVILPTPLADAIDNYGPNRTAWAWINDGKLTRLKVDK